VNAENHIGARCLIPAAGRGTRLLPITRTVPKALLPVGTRPMLQWCLTEALEGGFDEIVVVVGSDQPLLEQYVRDGEWRPGILPSLYGPAEAVEIEIVRQARPRGVVDAVLAAREWVEEERPFAVFLPDNVRIAGSPPIRAEHLSDAEADDVVLIACHRVGPEARDYYGNVGRAELEALAPAGARRRVTALQVRGEGSFRAEPEGAWRLAPRYTVTRPWIEAARAVAAAASGEREADDVEVHRRLVTDGRLFALPWQGTMVDAGHPGGYLWAHHLLHEASRSDREAEGEEPSAPLLQVEGLQMKSRPSGV
jgi:UTP-glucose-1-phosphate uridylyltransferase